MTVAAGQQGVQKTAPPTEPERLLALKSAALRRRRRDAAWRWVVRVLTACVVFGLWQIVGARINPLYLSTPTRIVRALWGMAKSGELGTAVGSSAAVIGMGFGLAVLVGIPLGILMGRVRMLETIFEPYVNALFVAPRVALVPLILIWFGIGKEAQVVVIFLSAVFPILINSYTGARNVNVAWIETGKSFGANRVQQFFQISLPGAVPFIATGLRLGIGHAVIGMVVAQMFLALDGLGELLVNYGNQFDTAHVFAVVIVISLLGVILTMLVKRLEQHFAHWKSSER